MCIPPNGTLCTCFIAFSCLSIIESIVDPMRETSSITIAWSLEYVFVKVSRCLSESYVGTFWFTGIDSAEWIVNPFILYAAFPVKVSFRTFGVEDWNALFYYTY